MYIDVRTMQLYLCLLLVVFSYSRIRASSSFRCRESGIISADRNILPLSGIAALRGSTDFTNQLLVDIIRAPSSAAQWCAAAHASPPAGNYINLTLSEDVLVEGIVSRGLKHGDDGVSFVSRFSLLYRANGTREGLQQYNKEFNSSSHQPRLYWLEPAIMTQQLQFLIRAAVIDGGFDYCWHLDIFGCRSADAVAVPAMVQTSPPPTPSPTQPAASLQMQPELSSVLASCSVQAVELEANTPVDCTSMLILAIALSGTVALLASLVIVTLCCALCYKTRSYSMMKRSLETRRSSTLQVASNVLYSTKEQEANGHLQLDTIQYSSVDYAYNQNQPGQNVAETYEAIEILPELFVVNPAYGRRPYTGEHVYRSLEQQQGTYPNPSNHDYDVPFVPDHVTK